MADTIVTPRHPFCATKDCWEFGTRNQLFVDGEVPPYDGFKIISGDKNKSLDGASYGVYCESCYEEPRLAEGFKEPKLDLSITDEEREFFERLKSKGIVQRKMKIEEVLSK